MSTDDEDSPYPRSVRHKQILDKAAAHPDASMDEFASMVPSATTELVERTLDEYGDPATAGESDASDGGDEQGVASGEATETEPTDGDGTEMTETADDSTEAPATPESGEPGDVDGGEDSAVASSVDPARDGDEHTESAGETDAASGDSDSTHAGDDEDTVPRADEFSPKQREVLDVIAANPTATQREIGEALGVSSATVNNRVNSIDGFEWADRASFVDEVFELDATLESETTAGNPVAPGEVESALADIESHLTALDERIERLEAGLDQDEGPSESVASGLDDPELVHKVVHACLESERITEDEELRLLQQILC
ncbi:Winged helix-turn-helix DNA-binding [Halovenus aranensis]|uniref:Winged helix-turn-helix DNA-binding n=1 Tax=Halovenus aranensis TaxID=890420 RepID=A0A1G8XYH8_9EURY|nr:winged helix-turn-helix transcriptional regulator [Halovenus aranensis]SDJ94935.1 Winged helix-turn-helix DNA-binding [Halovenus aranensis]